MRTMLFIREIFKKFSFQLIMTAGLLMSVNFFVACSLLSISPIIDMFVHPNLEGISPLTAKVVSIMRFFNIPIALSNLLIIFVSFVTLSCLLQVGARFAILKTKYAVLRDIILETFKDFFDASWYFFSSSKQGVLLNTFTRELNVIGDAFGSMAMLFAYILQAIFFLAVPLYISWQITIISLAIAILFAVPFILLGKFAYHLGLLNTNTANHLMSVIHENISLAKIVLGYGNRDKSADSLAKAFDSHRDVTIKSQTLDWSIGILYRPFGVFTVMIALFTAHRFGISFSEITVLLLALLQLFLSISNLTTQRNALENFFPSYEQVKNLARHARELRQVSGNREFKGFSKELALEKLFFAYPQHKPVLADITMRISKGSMVAVVGESGAGKSTLIDMIMAFHQPLSGKVTFDGIPLSDFEICSYRRKIGYVPQDSVLFDMTIRDNLLWSHETASDDEIMRACRQASAEEFIGQLPQGYNTVVGDRGVRLSGGQVQRLALARAILRKPELLILDEATSSLDTYSERLIQQAIENIAKETTIIVIAHRLSTIINADYVYVLKEGRIAEEGTYAELLRMNGHFNDMIHLQALEAVKQDRM